MPKPTDEKLYESIKKDLFKKYVKPSAYRSGLLVQRYKEEYIKKHKNEGRKNRYILRHEKNEDWSKSGINTAGFWSRWLLWNKPSIKESYEDIKKRFL